MRGVASGTGAHNKALHQTGRGGVASFLRRRPVVEARPAGEGRCSTDARDGASTEAESVPRLLSAACLRYAVHHAAR